jgi:hypothetical protein
MIANAVCQAIAALFDLIAVFLWIFVAANDLVSPGLVVSLHALSTHTTDIVNTETSVHHFVLCVAHLDI